jgi:hypothetical protein
VEDKVPRHQRRHAAAEPGRSATETGPIALRVLGVLFAAFCCANSDACAISPEAMILHDPIGAMAKVDAVFTAIVVEQVLVPQEFKSRSTIKVLEVWKGNVSAVRFLDNYLGDSCSAHLLDGQSYLFYASRRENGGLRVSGMFVPISRAAAATETLRRNAL